MPWQYNSIWFYALDKQIMLDCIKVIKGVNKRIKQTRGDLEVYKFSRIIHKLPKRKT